MSGSHKKQLKERNSPISATTSPINFEESRKNTRTHPDQGSINFQSLGLVLAGRKCFRNEAA